MGIARRQRRMFQRAYQKATKQNVVGVQGIKGNTKLQQLINSLKKEYEAQSSSK